MKLNYKRTSLVGLAFLSILAFWSVYDFVIPLILRDTFALGDDIAGIVMALDNILALFLLPLFGALSDKTKSRFGKRKPFIVIGTAAASVLIFTLHFADQSRSFGPFFVSLGLLLIAMGTYRSPAVALMPDVTPKPLRSKGNAIINLMGALGGMFSLGMIPVLVKEIPGEQTNYLPLYAATAGLMIIAVLVLAFTVNENKLTAEMQAINYGVSPEEDQVAKSDGTGAEKLSPELRKSLALILASVSLWFMGYNAVTTAFSKYATAVWGMSSGAASTCLLVATGAAVISYLPVGMLSTKIGRKKMILGGIVLLAVCFAIGALAKEFSPLLYVMFALVGFAWASINVNSYPMVVEISKGSDVGKYTGYYYTFSMSAQILTPIISGYLLEHVGYWTLFPYSAVMVALAFFTMFMTKHGDSKPVAPSSKLEAFDTPD